MQHSAKLGLIQRVFSFPVMLCAMLVMLMILTVKGRFNDPDMWWHLKVGEIIWNTHLLPRMDLFSWTTGNHPWIAHEWLSQLLIYGAYKAGAYTGLMLWLCILSSLLIVGQYAICALYSGNAKVALVGALVVWLFSTVGLAIRPHMVGYVLLTAELLIIHLARTSDRRWFFALPPLFTIWVNCHGSFFLGLLVLGVYVVCSLFEFESGGLSSSRWPGPVRNRGVLALALSIPVLFVNPIGPGLVLYPLNLMFNQSANLGAVEEWQPLRFDEPRGVAVLAAVALLVVLILIRKAELRLDELVLLGMGFGLGILHTRLLVVCGILLAPILCRLGENAWERYDRRRDLWLANAVMITSAAAIVLATFPAPTELDEQVRKSEPVAAVEFIQRTGLSGRLLNDYVFGGFLIWALPSQKVFIDGRADIFDWTGVLQDYGSWATLQQDPGSMLDRKKIDYCVLSRTAPISRVLPYIPGWKKVYSDELAVIFVRSTAVVQKP